MDPAPGPEFRTTAIALVYLCHHLVERAQDDGCKVLFGGSGDVVEPGRRGICTNVLEDGGREVPYLQDLRSHRRSQFIRDRLGNKVFDEDVIVSGLECLASYTSTKVIVDISKGKVVTDDVFCEINSPTQISYTNAYIYDETGYFVLLSDFKNYTTLNRNVFRFMFAYFDVNGNPIDDFDPSRNRVVFGVWQIVKNGTYIDHLMEYRNDTITLGGIDYIVRKLAFDPLSRSVLVDGGLID